MQSDEGTLAPTWDWPGARERCLREAKRYTRSPLDAEDIVQEALLRAWKTRTKLRNTSHPLPWLLQITRNEALRALSRTSRDGARSVLVEDPEPASAAAPEEWADAIATKLDMEAVLGRLEEDEQTLVSLRYSEELTHSHIADLMAMPVGTCKVRLHRLRKRLSVMLAEEGQNQ